MRRPLRGLLALAPLTLLALQTLGSEDALFNNAYRPRREVLATLGYDPGWQPGTPLNGVGGGGGEVYRIRPPGRPSRVIKIAPEETVSNELFGREVLRGFELFRENLYCADVVAYNRWLFLRPVLVMEDFGPVKKDGLRDSGSLPMRQKRALALFALTFGFHGFNGESFFDVGWARAGLFSFEMGRAPMEPDRFPGRIGITGGRPWVSDGYLNDLADYHDAIAQWKKTFARADAQKNIQSMLRRAGVSEDRVARDMRTFATNAARIEEVLAADIAAANQRFRDHARDAGLDDAQAEALGAINKAAHVAPEGCVARDIVRFLNRRAGRSFSRKLGFALSPEEFHALAVQRQRGLLTADRKAVLRVAAAGRLGPYSAAAVRRALNELQRVLPPARS